MVVLPSHPFIHLCACSEGACAKDDSIRGGPQVEDGVHEAGVDWHPCRFCDARSHHRVEWPSRESARSMVSVCSSWHKQGMTMFFACHSPAYIARCMWLRTNPCCTWAKGVMRPADERVKVLYTLCFILRAPWKSMAYNLNPKFFAGTLDSSSCTMQAGWKLQATLSPLSSQACFNSNNS
jgi:hypothetical protein